MNHVMSGTDLRAERREATRRTILHEFSTMLHEDNPATISMPAVARRANVSVRTLYRYFPDKDSLMQAASGWFDEDARAAIGGRLTRDTLGSYLDELWTQLAANVPAVRAQHAGGPGRELRQRRLERARIGIEAQLPAEIPPERRGDVTDLVVAVTSSSMMLELVDRMGHDPRHAAALATRLAELVIADATDTPRRPAEVGTRDTSTSATSRGDHP